MAKSESLHCQLANTKKNKKNIDNAPPKNQDLIQLQRHSQTAGNIPTPNPKDQERTRYNLATTPAKFGKIRNTTSINWHATITIFCDIGVPTHPKNFNGYIT